MSVETAAPTVAKTVSLGHRLRIRARVTERRAGVAIIMAVVVLAVAVPLSSPYGIEEIVARPQLAPSAEHLFGTDSLGRDVFVRAFFAARIDLGIALLGVGLSLLLGTLVGVAAAYSPWSLVDVVLMRLVDAVVAIPFVVLVLAVVVVVGPDREVLGLPAGLASVVVALVATGWAIYARMTRAEVMTLKSCDFVIAVHILGFSWQRIVGRHLLPTAVRQTTTYAATDAILAITTTASLAFLGAGVQPPTPEWGNMMFGGLNVISSAWWISVFPGLLVVLVGLGLALVADSYSGDGAGSRHG